MFWWSGTVRNKDVVKEGALDFRCYVELYKGEFV